MQNRGPQYFALSYIKMFQVLTQTDSYKGVTSYHKLIKDSPLLMTIGCNPTHYSETPNNHQLEVNHEKPKSD